MTDPNHKAEPSRGGVWLLEPVALAETTSALIERLGAGWAVEQETDCEGEVSIVAFPTIEDEARPSFILFEHNGQPRVAMVWHDQWAWDRGFSNLADAVGALVAKARDPGTKPARSRTNRRAPAHAGTLESVGRGSGA